MKIRRTKKVRQERKKSEEGMRMVPCLKHRASKTNFTEKKISLLDQGLSIHKCRSPSGL